MSVKKSTIEAKMRLERENEKIEASKIKTVDYYEEKSAYFRRVGISCS